MQPVPWRQQSKMEYNTTKKPSPHAAGHPQTPQQMRSQPLGEGEEMSPELLKKQFEHASNAEKEN